MSFHNRPKSTQMDTSVKYMNIEELVENKNNWISNFCDSESDLKKQLTSFISIIEAPPNETIRYQDVWNDVECATKSVFVQYEFAVRIFGSSVTGLGLKGGDVDLFVDFKNRPTASNDELANAMRNCLRRFRNLFKNVITIHAKVPIVRCIHRTGTKCDLSFSNYLGIVNSELIKFYLSCDERIRPFLMIIKFWAMKQGLHGSCSLTSYALVMMGLYFLQQLDHSIIPTVNYLQKSCFRTNMVDGWNCAFITDKSLLPPVRNKMTILELLHCFFKLYAYFDFGVWVISPLLGKPILKAAFIRQETLPEEFKIYKVNLQKDPEANRFDYMKFICVQDPFKLSHNVTRNAPKPIFLKLQEKCQQAFDVCEYELKRIGKKNHSSKFLNDLFTVQPSSVETKKNKKRKTEAVGNVIRFYLGKHVLYDQTMALDENSIRDLWSDVVVKILVDIFTKVLKCEVALRVGEAYEMNTMENMDSKQSVTRLSKVMDCKSKYFLLEVQERKDARNQFEFPNTLPLLEREEMISDYLCSTTLTEGSNTCEFVANFKLKKDPTHVMLEIIPAQEKKKTPKNIGQVFNSLKNLLVALVDDSFNSILNKQA